MILTKGCYDFTCDFNSLDGKEKVNFRILKKAKGLSECNDCGKVYCDNFDYDIYLSSIETLVSSVFCMADYEDVGRNLRNVLINYSQKLNIKEPEIYWLEKDNSVCCASASPNNEVCVKPLACCDFQNNDNKIQELMEKVLVGGAEIDTSQKLDITYPYAMERLNSEPAFLVENILHELTHINQYAYANDLINGKDIPAPYELMHIYSLMRVCCLAINEDYIKGDKFGFHYFFRANELDARRNTLDELMRLSKCKDLSEETRNSLLAVFRADVFDEIMRLKDTFKSDLRVLEIADYTRDEFAKRFGEYGFAKALIERYNYLSCEEDFLKMLVQHDVKFEEQINYALNAKKETPFNEMSAFGVELALNNCLKNCKEREQNI